MATFCYTYIRLNDGKVINKVWAPLGIDGHLRQACETQKHIALHLSSGMVLNKNVHSVIAIEKENREIFAVPAPEITKGKSIFMETLHNSRRCMPVGQPKRSIAL